MTWREHGKSNEEEAAAVGAARMAGEDPDAQVSRDTYEASMVSFKTQTTGQGDSHG